MISAAKQFFKGLQIVLVEGGHISKILQKQGAANARLLLNAQKNSWAAVLFDLVTTNKELDILKWKMCFGSHARKLAETFAEIQLTISLA